MACTIVALAVCGASAAAQPPAIDIRLDLPDLPAARLERARSAVADGARLLVEWFPPAPSSVIVSPDHVRPRWLEPERGAAIEHAALRDIAMQLWSAEGAADPFRTALAEYSAAMAIHRTLATRHVHVERFFNGEIPYALRQVALTPRGSAMSPRLRYFGPERVLGVDVDRWLRSLATAERYLGWPALQQAVAELRTGGAITPARLHAVLADQTGRDLEWLFAMFDRHERLDYAVVEFASAPSAGNRFETTVTVARLGPGIMAGTNRPRADGPAHSLPVVVRFDDGSETRDWIDGRDEQTVLRYDSVAPARLASVDPEALLMLDADRTNNTRTIGTTERDAVGLRLAFNWLGWLQDAMLTCTAVM